MESEGEGTGRASWAEETKEEHEHRHGDEINSSQPREWEGRGLEFSSSGTLGKAL